MGSRIAAGHNASLRRRGIKTRWPRSVTARQFQSVKALCITLTNLDDGAMHRRRFPPRSAVPLPGTPRDAVGEAEPWHPHVSISSPCPEPSRFSPHGPSHSPNIGAGGCPAHQTGGPDRRGCGPIKCAACRPVRPRVHRVPALLHRLPERAYPPRTGPTTGLAAPYSGSQHRPVVPECRSRWRASATLESGPRRLWVTGPIASPPPLQHD